MRGPRCDSMLRFVFISFFQRGIKDTLWIQRLFRFILNFSAVMWRALQRIVGCGKWRSLSTNYSSEGHPGINTAHKHRMLRVLVYIFWKISLCHSVSCSLLHEPCGSDVLNKRLRKFDRSWKERRTVAHHLQAAFWCPFHGHHLPHWRPSYSNPAMSSMRAIETSRGLGSAIVLLI